MAEAQDVDTLKRRGRRRLVGAVALVLLAVIVLPMVFDPEPIVTRLSEAKLPYFTEAVATAKGTVTRVRAGPFASKDAAEKALEKLKGLGFKPGSVTSKS